MMIEYLFVALIGLFCGSFISMASYRLPIVEDLVFKRSYCPKCYHSLNVIDLIPLISWGIFGGKCRHCKAKVSIRYPLIELVTAVFFVLLFHRFGFSTEMVLLACITVALLVLVVTDFEHYIIPDQTLLFMIPVAIAYLYITDAPPIYYVIGPLLGGGIGLILRYGFQLIRKKEGLGMGDVKFLVVVGLLVDPMLLPVFFFLSGGIGVVTAMCWNMLGKGKLFPFGPSLAVALWLCIVYPEYIHHVVRF